MEYDGNEMANGEMNGDSFMSGNNLQQSSMMDDGCCGYNICNQGEYVFQPQ